VVFETSDIRISLQKLKFPFFPGSDFIRIRDGFSMSSPLLLEFSGTATNLNSLSNGTQVYFGFSADSNVEQRGFNATWREV
jgi:hypothetical protein